MPKELKLYNTLTRKKEVFKPISEDIVKMYSCGPTVYSEAHIGNMRAAVFADVLRRTIKMAGYNLKSVMNITDVGHLTDDADAGDDKMEVGAKREQKSVWDIAKKYTDKYFEDTDKLNVIRPDIICKATDYIQQQIEYIKKLEENGFTYKTSDGIYFDTSKLDDYGKLAKLDIEGLSAGIRVDDSLNEKKNKTDFALWKFSPKNEKRQMEWDSPWGVGFPGWHIECSVMSMAHLGFPFDIHTGGVDHIPVHHTNEIAQNEAYCCHCDDKQSVNYWLHNNHLQLVDGKMSKSLGNVITVSTIEEKGIYPLALRYLYLLSHYRAEMKFSWDILKNAEKAYLRLEEKIYLLQKSLSKPQKVKGKRFQKKNHLSPMGQDIKKKIENALLDDMATPVAIVLLRDAIDNKELPDNDKVYIAKFADSVLGLRLVENRRQKFNKKKSDNEIPQEIIDLMEKRKEAKLAKDFAIADAIRNEIRDSGYEITDNPDGTYSLKKV